MSCGGLRMPWERLWNGRCSTRSSGRHDGGASVCDNWGNRRLQAQLPCNVSGVSGRASWSVVVSDSAYALLSSLFRIVVLKFLQLVPPAVHQRLLAVARPLVEILAAPGAESPAFFPADILQGESKEKSLSHIVGQIDDRLSRRHHLDLRRVDPLRFGLLPHVMHLVPGSEGLPDERDAPVTGDFYRGRHGRPEKKLPAGLLQRRRDVHTVGELGGKSEFGRRDPEIVGVNPFGETADLYFHYPLT